MTPEPPDLPPTSVSVSDALVADAAGAQATDAHAHAHAHSAGNTHCLNCGTKLTGPFCSACGQHDFDFHRSFRHVFMEALENIFHFDGKFFQNLVTLLFRPGRLTAEFNAGKRAAQVPPFRLYIFTAFVFFLLAFSSDQRDTAARASLPGSRAKPSFTFDGQTVTREQLVKAAQDPAYAEQLRQEIAARLRPHAGAVADQSPEATGTSGSPDSLAHSLQQAADEFRDRKVDERKARRGENARTSDGLSAWAERQGYRASDPAFQRELGRSFVNAIPKMLLLCLPAFALLTRVLFRKSGQVYLQHLVLALHFHTFIFVFLMFRDGWEFIFAELGLGWPRSVFLLAAKIWLAVYPLLMLRRLFGNSWPKTILKTIILALTYGLLLGLAFLGTVAVLILMM